MFQLYTDIDWSDDKRDAVVLTYVGHCSGKPHIKYTVEGVSELSEFLQALTGSEHKADMTCIIETNHGLVINSLLEADLAVYLVNPNTIDRRRAASGAKTD